MCLQEQAEPGISVELRHLETLIAIEEEGTFTAAADLLSTVQSNVSEQIRQLEAELGVTLLARGRSGATPTESGEVVLQHARRIRREIEVMREDVAALQGLLVGRASFGIVGTASRWLVPALVSDLRRRAPGIELRVNEGASERLLAEVLTEELAQAVVTAPVRDERLAVEPLLEEALVGLAPPGVELPPDPVPFEELVKHPLVLPPAGNPLRIEIEQVARARDVQLPVAVEVEGIRLIADLVAANAGVAILPETAIPPELTTVRIFTIADFPPRRLALVSPKASPLSLADQAVRETVLRIVAGARGRPPRELASTD
jgi:LysR family transcriptional regulator, nitrogen assimilation regulatory protein